MIHTNGTPCPSKDCDSWLKVRRKPAGWKPDPSRKYQYAIWYVCSHGHSHFNEADKRYPEQPEGLFGTIEQPVQQTLIKSRPIPTDYESRRRKCWICKVRFLSEHGNELCSACIAKFGEQKVKAEPKPSLDKTPMTAGEKAKAGSGKRYWLQRLRATVPKATFASDRKDPEYVVIYRKIVADKLENKDNPEVLNTALLNELNKIGGSKKRGKRGKRRNV